MRERRAGSSSSIPSRVTGSAVLKGLLTGTADVHTRIADVGSPITLDAFAVDGTVSLEHSTLGDLQIESAEVDGKYASRVGDLSKLTLTGPDVKVQASGRVALDTDVCLEPDVPHRGDQTRGARTARGSGIGRRVSGSRRHAHWQRRVAPDDREDERQRSWLEGQQRARRELPVHRDRTGSGCCEGARAVD